MTGLEDQRLWLSSVFLSLTFFLSLFPAATGTAHRWRPSSSGFQGGRIMCGSSQRAWTLMSCTPMASPILWSLKTRWSCSGLSQVSLQNSLQTLG